MTLPVVPMLLAHSCTQVHGHRNTHQSLYSTVRRLYLRVYDNRPNSFKSAPSPSSLCSSLTHTHRSIGYLNNPQPLSDSVVRLIYLRVDDNRPSSFKPAPSPSSLCYSLTHAHRSIGYINTPHPLSDSAVRLIYLRVDDSWCCQPSPSKSAPSPLFL
jgi:hypothetical protein